VSGDDFTQLRWMGLASKGNRYDSFAEGFPGVAAKSIVYLVG